MYIETTRPGPARRTPTHNITIVDDNTVEETRGKDSDEEPHRTEGDIMLCCWALHGIFCCCSGETVVTQLIPKVPELCNMTGQGGQWGVIEGDRGGEAQDNQAVHHEAAAHNETGNLEDTMKTILRARSHWTLCIL
jgi:hypothetical protein